jgi:hypothetical protein
MPIFSWQKILQTGDLKYIFKECRGRVTKKIGLHWLDLQQQYIDEFGLDERYKKLLRLQRKLHRLNLEYIISGDRFLLNLITVVERDIETLNQGEGVRFYDQLDIVEKYKGFEIDPKRYPVIKWYSALRNMAKDGKDD